MAEAIKLTERKLIDRADVRDVVREKYGEAALTVLNGQGAGCGGGNMGDGVNSCCDGDTITGGLYDATEAASLPEVAALPTDEKAALDGRIMGAFIRTAKPAACCGPDCCTPETSGAETRTSTAQPIVFTDRTDQTNTHDEREETGMLKLSAFKALLEAHRAKQFRLVLPSANAVPICFHITEVAYMQKRFIDCGGRLHTTHTCQLQAWVWTDTEHRLLAGKMANVLNKAQVVLPEDQDLAIEIEYEDVTISQYSVTGYTVTADAVTLTLGYKHTDCLAKDVCLPASPMAQESAGGDCCGSSCC